MIELKWDKRLEHLARVHAKKCVLGHSEQRSRTSRKFKTDISENIAHKVHYKFDGDYEWSGFSVEKAKKNPKSTEEPDFQTVVGNAVKDWAGESEHYDYYNDKCAYDEVCAHYTTMVNAQTEYVGCAGKNVK